MIINAIIVKLSLVEREFDIDHKIPLNKGAKIQLKIYSHYVKIP